VAIKLSQSLKQTQQLTMTPQLQQAIKLLTLTHLEMTNVIASEMVENPMLEELGSELDPLDNKGDVDFKLDKLESQNTELTADNFSGPELATGKDDFDWNKYIESYNNTSSSAPTNLSKYDPEEMPNYENMVSKALTLAEHLQWQLRMEELSEDESLFADQIIHNLNDDGYLDMNFEDLLANTKLERDHAYDILDRIKKLDPVGCACSTLQECLLVQAECLGQRLPLIEKIITDHLDDFQKRDYSGIAKKLGVAKDRIKDAELIILGLNPKPGRLISPDETQYVVPDIYVHEVGGEWQIKLNDEGVPRLKISGLYKTMIEAQVSAVNAEAKEYVQDKLRSAMWLIKSIQNRQKTIVKVTEAIVKYQPEFFRKGSQFLRPMILKDIANEIGMHESTVSRVTTNKFMHTPLGLFELKYFFNAGVGGKNGGVDVASESLKLKIKKMLEDENKKRPLSDQKIVQVLKAEGIEVARRTVAKYREMLNIQSSAKRKRLE
jgi:RNA polymerase sigma-54 factor